MKVAFLFCGRIKGFESCYESFKEYVLKPLNNPEFDSFLFHNSNNTSDNIDLFKILYNVIKFKSVDVTKDVDITKYKHIPLSTVATGYYRCIYMFYCLKGVFSLLDEVKTNEISSYDAIIYIRADILFKSPIMAPSDLTKSVFVPIGNDYAGLNDNLAIGSYENMKKYTSTFENIIDLYEITKAGLHPETYNKLNANYNELLIERFPLEYELSSFRF